MAPTNADKLFALEYVRREVNAAYDDAKNALRDELAELNESHGATEIASKHFGAAAGKFKFKFSKPKTVVEYNLADDEEFAEWLEGNQQAALSFAKLHAAELAEWWFSGSGELPDGVARVEYDEPERVVGAQIYGFKPDMVAEKLGGNVFGEVNRLLLGDGE